MADTVDLSANSQERTSRERTFIPAEGGDDGTLQHPGYIGDWLKALRNDKRALFQAAGRARKACEYLYDVTGAEEPSWIVCEAPGLVAA